jgi:hypothetical protein
MPVPRGSAQRSKDSARGSDGRRAERIRSLLVVAEMAMAVVLLIGAGLDHPQRAEAGGALAGLRPGISC